MGREIERKFLVNTALWQRPTHGMLLRQGYLSTTPERTVRVRIAGGEAFLTIKGAAQGVTRAEYEYSIPVRDASELLELCERPLIEKTRYEITFGEYTWVVDEFHGENEGLTLAEVELPRADAPVALPDWAGEEVSTDSRFFNASLSRHPYRSWGTEEDS